MPYVLGVSLTDDSVTFAHILCERDDSPRLDSLLEVSRESFFSAGTDVDGIPGDMDSDIGSAENSSEQTSGDEQVTPVVVVPPLVSEFITGVPTTEVVCIYEPRRFFSELLTFPFSDFQKVEQVAPLELEDALPFEIADYLLEPVLVGGSSSSDESYRSDGHQFLILAAEEEHLRQELQFLNKIGLDPAILLPRVVAFAGLSQFAVANEGSSGSAISGSPISGNAALCVAEDRKLLFAQTKQGKPLVLRTVDVRSKDEAFGEILSTLLSSARLSGEMPTKLITLPPADSLGISGIESLELTPELFGLYIESGISCSRPVDLSCLTALASARVRRLPTPNFRKGRYRYKGNLKAYIEPFLEDQSYLVTLFLAALLWLGLNIYAGHSQQEALDDEAARLINIAFPGDMVLPGTELGYVEEKLKTLESRMKGLGSISSLSPLEALRELSEGVPSGIDVAFDSLSISQVGVTFGGSVVNMASVGRLSGALSQKFCDVKVDPRGSIPGGNRVRIVGELQYCQKK